MHGWTYLASVLDVCTRKIVGYHYSKKMNKSLVISSLSNAYSNQGCPFDNAPMKAFHALLKKKVYICHYQTFEQAKLSLFEYIEGFYNRNRIHSAINYLTPIAFEKACFAS
jgi:transposase InsO family protein